MAKHEIIEFSGNLVKVISQSENYNNEFLYLLMKSGIIGQIDPFPSASN